MTWLFTAKFKDGSTIEQTQEDKCLTRNDGTGSAFTDVLSREKDLDVFILTNVANGRQIALECVTGHFIIGGLRVQLHEQNFEPEKHDLRLIYFRENRVDANHMVGSDNVQITKHYINKYFIGWQTTVDGKNIQHTVAVDA